MVSSKVELKESYYRALHKLAEEARPIFARLSGTPLIDIINTIEAELSSRHAFFSLFSNYEHQVLTGGHLAYFSNGYHSSEQMGVLDEISLNDDLFQKLKSLGKNLSVDIDDKQELTQFIAHLETIQIAIDDREYVTETCRTCCGDGHENIDNPDYQGDDINDPDSLVKVKCDDCHGSGKIHDKINPNKGGWSSDFKHQCNIADKKISPMINNIYIAISN